MTYDVTLILRTTPACAYGDILREDEPLSGGDGVRHRLVCETDDAEQAERAAAPLQSDSPKAGPGAELPRTWCEQAARSARTSPDCVCFTFRSVSLLFLSDLQTLCKLGTGLRHGLTPPPCTSSRSVACEVYRARVAAPLLREQAKAPVVAPIVR